MKEFLIVCVFLNVIPFARVNQQRLFLILFHLRDIPILIHLIYSGFLALFALFVIFSDSNTS